MAGILLAVLVGFDAAVLNVPQLIARERYNISDESWILSFGVGAFGAIVSYTLLLWLASLVPGLSIKFPDLQPAKVAAPATVAGCLWTLGYWF